MCKVVADSTELAADDVAEGCEADIVIVLADVEQEINLLELEVITWPSAPPMLNKEK